MLLHALLFVLACANISAASFTETVLSGTSSTVVCKTQKVSTSGGPAPTTTSTVTQRPDYEVCLITSTPTSTITPAPVTVTSTATATSTVSTTLAPITGTATTTVVTVVSSTSTITITTVPTLVLTTTVTETTTSVVATSSGYVPIDQALGISSSSKKRRNALHPRADLRPRKAANKLTQISPADIQKSKYNGAVSCIDYVRVIYTIEIIKVKPAKTVTLAPSTVTNAASTTVTTTATVTPAPVTTTTTITQTQTDTLDTSVTVTAPVVISTATATVTTTSSVYAACTGSNILPAASGYAWAGTYDNSGLGSSVNAATNSYDCCVACQTDNGCINGFFRTDTAVCTIFDADSGSVCPNNENARAYATNRYTNQPPQDLFDAACVAYAPLPQ